MKINRRRLISGTAALSFVAATPAIRPESAGKVGENSYRTRAPDFFRPGIYREVAQIL